MLNLYGQLLDKCIPGRDFFADLLVREHHFIEGIAEHGSALFKIPAFCNDLRPLHQLANLAETDFGIFGGKIDHLS